MLDRPPPPAGWLVVAHMCCLVLANGSYGQGEGTNGGRLRVFSSAQAPWRVLLQALDPTIKFWKVESGTVLYGTNQKGVCWINAAISYLIYQIQ